MRRTAPRSPRAFLVAASLAILTTALVTPIAQAQSPTPVPPTPTTAATVAPATNTPAATSVPATNTPAATGVPATSTPAPTAQPAEAPAVPHDARYFAETRYRIDNDQIWNYFNARGGIDIFGFPVSRTFTFLGCTSQIFQRQIAQVCQGTGARLMNVLDDLFPYTQVNFAHFPDVNQDMKNGTPGVGEPNYDTRMLDFVRANAPDTFSGLNVRFQSTFFGLITAAMLGTNDQGIVNITNLEVWGAPISPPQFDPNNQDFVYQRFQRGIMHHIASQNSTRAVLLADYVKQLMRDSEELPIDLREQAQNDRLFRQYCPGAPQWVCRPDVLPASDLTFAFEVG